MQKEGNLLEMESLLRPGLQKQSPDMVKLLESLQAAG